MIHLRFMTEIPHYMRPLQQAKQSFEQLHPDVSIDIRLAVDGFETAQALEADDAPDIVELGGLQVSNADGLFIDLLPFVLEAGELWDDWHPGLRRVITHFGMVPGVPLEIMMPLIMYNKSMFDKAVLAYPADGWTWDDMVDLGKRLTIRDADGQTRQYGLGMGVDIEWWEPFILRNGGRYMALDGSTAHGYVDSPATIEAFRKVIDVFRLHRIIRMPNEPSRMKEGHEYEEAAMNFTFGWHFFHHKDLDRQYGVVGLPKMPGGVETNMIYMAGAHVTKKSSNPRLAWEFLRLYLLESRSWILPNTKTQAAEQRLADHPIWSRYLQELDHIQLGAFFLNRKWNASRQLINDDMYRLIIEGGDVAQTVRSWTRFA